MLKASSASSILPLFSRKLPLSLQLQKLPFPAQSQLNSLHSPPLQPQVLLKGSSPSLQLQKLPFPSAANLAFKASSPNLAQSQLHSLHYPPLQPQVLLLKLLSLPFSRKSCSKPAQPSPFSHSSATSLA